MASKFLRNDEQVEKTRQHQLSLWVAQMQQTSQKEVPGSGRYLTFTGEIEIYHSFLVLFLVTRKYIREAKISFCEISF